MIKTTTLVLFMLICLNTSAQVSAKKIVQELLLDKEGAVFRGYSFQSLMSTIQSTEEKRQQLKFEKFDQHKDYQTVLKYTIDYDADNYISVIYYIKSDHLGAVLVNFSLKSESLLNDIHDYLLKYYPKKDKSVWLVYQTETRTEFSGTYTYDSMYNAIVEKKKDSEGKFLVLQILKRE